MDEVTLESRAGVDGVDGSRSHRRCKPVALGWPVKLSG
jgi:hypothetical protein